MIFTVLCVNEKKRLSGAEIQKNPSQSDLRRVSKIRGTTQIVRLSRTTSDSVKSYALT